MQYHTLVKKIIELQDKICPVLETAENAGLQDDNTPAKMAAAQEWARIADKKISESQVPEQAPDITPVVEFANHLFTYGEALDPHTQSLIEKYREYVQELFEQVESPKIK